jgi:hypothetical protein
MFRTTLISIATLALATSACGKDSEKGGAGGGGEMTTLELTKLGLKAQGPKGADIGDGVLGDGVLVQAPGYAVNIELAKDSTPATADAAKQEADMYTPKNIKTEKLADGFVFTFENKGGMGTNYWTQVRRDIGGKSYWCTANGPQAEQQANAVALCKSLSQ